MAIASWSGSTRSAVARISASLFLVLGTSALADQIAQPSASQSMESSGSGAYFDDWFARVSETQSSQPTWMTPIATVTPRLEEEVRYDQYWEHQGTGGSLDLFGSGKGLELIPTTTNEIIINAPSYEERSVKKPVNGWGDWPFFLVKQRLVSAPEQSGNYIISAFFAVQAPTGSAAFTNHAWLLTPTLAAGKGWGDFDIQATVGVPIPTAHENTIGIPILTNIALQYHFAEYFWPEIEVNNTYWTDGERGGKNQIFLTPGIVLGRFPVYGRTKFIIGAGYQFAVSPKLTPDPLTPLYQHSWIITARLAF